MDIQIMERNIIIDPDSSSVEQLVIEIESLLNQNKMLIEHMEVDGETLYGEYLNYFQKHWCEIKRVIVFSQSVNQQLQTRLIENNSYLQRAIPRMKELAIKFYQGPSDKTWKEFGELLGGFQWLIDSAGYFGGHGIYPNECSKFRCDLQFKIVELGNAVENLDSVIMADLLIFEIIPIIEKFNACIAQIFVEGGDGKDAN